MKLHDQTLDPRRAGQVTRFHTWPRLREQSVGEHSWQVLRILLAIWPGAPRHLLIHCVTHDVGETVSGDPPYPIKVLNVDLKQACDRIEREAHLLMSDSWRLPLPCDLSEEEKIIFKLAEFVEMWEWGVFEVGMGNSYAGLVVDRCVEGILERVEALRAHDAEWVRQIVQNVGWYTEKRRAT